TLLAALAEEGRARLGLVVDPVAARLAAGLDQAEEGCGAPARRRVTLVGPAVVVDLRLAGGARPAGGAALVDRMQRVDEQDGARQRQARRHRALAEAAHHLALGGTSQALAGDPLRERRQLTFFHSVNPPCRKACTSRRKRRRPRPICTRSAAETR